jgi:MFS family permease
MEGPPLEPGKAIGEVPEVTQLSAFLSAKAATRFYVPFLLGINLVGMMQIISASWIPTFLIRSLNAEISSVGFLFGNALLFASIGTLAGPMIAERFVLRGRKDAAYLMLVVSIPAAALSFLAAVWVRDLVWAAVLIAAFHTFSNSVIVMPSVVISSIGGVRSRARLVAAHLFVQAILAYTIGPVLVPVLSQSLFHGSLGPAMFTIGIIAFPLSSLLLALGWRPYRQTVYGPSPQTLSKGSHDAISKGKAIRPQSI